MQDTQVQNGTATMELGINLTPEEINFLIAAMQQATLPEAAGKRLAASVQEKLEATR